MKPILTKPILFIAYIGILSGLVGGISELVRIYLVKYGFWPPRTVVLWLLMAVLLILMIWSVLRALRIGTVNTFSQYISFGAYYIVIVLSAHWIFTIIKVLLR